MSRLEELAKRIGEIGEEIKDLKSQREVNLQHCHANDSEEFGSQRQWIDKEWNVRENCLHVAYRWSKESRDHGEYISFYEHLAMEGCNNCIAAYEAKIKIGTLKQERGRLVGNISKIGKTL